MSSRPSRAARRRPKGLSLDIAQVGDMPTEDAARADVSAANKFAWLRTRLAADRTQMAWVRTGVSLIAFGFTIEQVLEKFPLARHPNAPRALGLALIGTGIIALLLAVYDYRHTIKFLWSPEVRPLAVGPPYVQRALPVTIIMLIVGIASFIAVLFHV